MELAWRLVRFQPEYPPVKKRLSLLARGAQATGGARKKAIVAVARQLAVDLWRLHTGQCSAKALGLKQLILTNPPVTKQPSNPPSSLWNAVRVRSLTWADCTDPSP